MSQHFDLSHVSGLVPPKIKKYDPSYVTRYVIVTELVKQAEKLEGKRLKVLDLGGYNGAARNLLPNNDITIIDVTPDTKLEKYVVTEGSKIPFDDGAFDVVISCDTLEHVPPAERNDFIDEMLRVSKSYCFIGAPFGTKAVEMAEENSNTFYQGITGGESYVWLKEHAQYKLPKKEWLEKRLASKKVNYTHFDHTSLNVWGLMLRVNFFLADNIKTVSAKIGTKLAKANDTYLKNFTFNDFPPDGYRTFYVISKKGKPEVSLPPYSEDANQDFLNHLYRLAGECMQQYTREFGALRDGFHELQKNADILYKENLELIDKVNLYESKLQSKTLRARSHHMAEKISSTKNSIIHHDHK